MRGQDRDNRAHHVVLDGKDVLKFTVVALGPAVGPGGGFDQLGRYANAVADTPHTALQDIAHTEFASDLPGVGRFALVLEARVAGDDKQLGEAGHLGCDVFDNAVGDILLLRIAAQISEREHTAMEGACQEAQVLLSMLA